jgi:hypothetical protein
MVRGLDGFMIIDTRVALCSFEGPGELVSHLFPVALARGKHLFPFRTEQLSPSAPMVLGSQGPGRVGRRRFFLRAAFGRLVVVAASLIVVKLCGVCGGQGHYESIAARALPVVILESR